jgi:hypothetical protein
LANFEEKSDFPAFLRSIKICFETLSKPTISFSFFELDKINPSSQATQSAKGVEPDATQSAIAAKASAEQATLAEIVPKFIISVNQIIDFIYLDIADLKKNIDSVK